MAKGGGGGFNNPASRFGGMTRPMQSGMFGAPQMSQQFGVNSAPPAPSFGGMTKPAMADESGGGSGPTAAPSMPQTQQPFNWAQHFSQMNLPGGMPNSNPNAAFNRPQMSSPFSMGDQGDQSGQMQPPRMMANAMNTPSLDPRQGPMSDPRMMYQRANPYQPQGMPFQGGMPSQPTTGTFPGAQPPPGWQAPPPGPFAQWMNPIMASMIGRAGAAPPGMNAYNPGNNSWGNIDWFPGYPKG